jgi:hypothetical protein
MQRLFAVLLLLAAASAPAGVTYRLESPALAGRVIAEGRNFRLELENGTALITSDGGKTLTLLDPAKKTFSTMTVADLAGAGMTISDPKVSTRDLGDGGVLEGYPTRRWSVDIAFDAALEITGEKATTHMNMRIESWRTDRLPEAAASIIASQGTRTGIAAIDKLLDAMTAANAKGFPLKEVTTIGVKVGNGQETSTTTSLQVHDVRQHVATTPAQFAIPSGYKRARSD